MSKGAFETELAFEDALVFQALALVAFVVEDNVLDFGLHVFCVSLAANFLPSICLFNLAIHLQFLQDVYTR